MALALEVRMSVLELCDPEMAAISVEANVADAVRLMLDHHVGAVGVIDSEGRVAGIFTERDVLRKLALAGRDPEKTPLRELMTTPVEMATLATGPGEALAIMVERHFRHLPVVDNDGKLLGMLSIRNVLQWRVNSLAQELDSMEQYMANDGPGG
jgi:CBS domain-containing protein